IDVLGIGLSNPGPPEFYYQYEVQPTTGSVRETKEDHFPDYKHENIPHTFYDLTGAIDTCRKEPQAVSPNGQYAASCRAGESDEFFVNDQKGARISYHGTLGQRRSIRGFGWGPILAHWRF